MCSLMFISVTSLKLMVAEVVGDQATYTKQDAPIVFKAQVKRNLTLDKTGYWLGVQKCMSWLNSFLCD